MNPGNPEIKKRVLEWKLTPVEKREPKTIVALATELGCSESNVRQHLKSLPDSAADMIRKVEESSLEHYEAIVAKLVDLAVAGDREAIKTYLKEVAGNYRQEQRTKRPTEERTLNIAIGLLPNSVRPQRASGAGREITTEFAIAGEAR